MARKFPGVRSGPVSGPLGKRLDRILACRAGSDFPSAEPDGFASGSAEPGVAAVSFRPLRRGGRFRGICLPSRGYRL